MSNLPLKKIDDFCYVTDYVANGSFASLKENVRYLSAPDYAILVRLTDSTKKWNGKYVYVTKESYDFLNKSSLKPGDLIMSNVGEPGKVFIVPDLKMPMTLGPNSILIRPDSTASNMYLYYYFLSPSGKNQIESICSATAQKKFNKTSFRRLTIPLPPLEIQNEIVTTLDKVSLIATKRKESYTLLDKYIDSLFFDMFGDPILNPKGWDIKPLGDNAEIKIGPFGSLLHQADYVIGGIPLVNPKHLKENKIVTDPKNTITPEKHAQLEAYHLRKGDVVLGRRGEIGRCGYVEDDQDGFLCGTGSMFIRPGSSLSSKFLIHLISTPQITAKLTSMAKGITMKNLNANTVQNLVLPLPPIEEQIKFVDVIHSVQLAKNKMLSQIDELDNDFNALIYSSFTS